MPPTATATNDEPTLDEQVEALVSEMMETVSTLNKRKALYEDEAGAERIIEPSEPEAATDTPEAGAGAGAAPEASAESAAEPDAAPATSEAPEPSETLEPAVEEMVAEAAAPDTTPGEQDASASTEPDDGELRELDDQLALAAEDAVEGDFEPVGADAGAASSEKPAAPAAAEKPAAEKTGDAPAPEATPASDPASKASPKATPEPATAEDTGAAAAPASGLRALADRAAPALDLFERVKPLLERALALVNAPLNRLSREKRHTLGWFALVTLFNALALWLWLLMR